MRTKRIGLAALAAVFAFAGTAYALTFGFAAVSETATSGDQVFAIALADWNGDGILDCATASLSGNFQTHLGNGDGTFQSTVTVTGSGGIGSVVFADTRSNGRLDMIGGGNDNALIEVCLNNGSGGFASAVTYGAGSTCYRVAVGDFNGDGHPDIVSANLGSSTISLVLGVGDGTFGTQTTKATAVNPFGIAVGDLRGNGHLDVVTGNDAGSVSVLLGDGAGGFATHVDYTANAGTHGVALGDLRRNGRLDIVAVNWGGNAGTKASVFLSNGDGTFANKVDYTTATGPLNVALGDLNGDGILDMVTSTYANNNGTTVSVLLGVGDGTFGAKTDYGASRTGIADVAIGDLNRDGKLDIVMAQHGSGDNIGFLLQNTTDYRGECQALGGGLLPFCRNLKAIVGEFRGGSTVKGE